MKKPFWDYGIRKVSGWICFAVCMLQGMPVQADMLRSIQVLRDGTGLEGVTSVAVSPDGKHVYGTSSDDDAVGVFKRVPGTGELSFVQVVHDGVAGVDGLNEAQEIIISPDGKHAYVASRGDELAVFSRDSSSGQLSFIEVHVNGQNGVAGLVDAESLAISPDGKHVYVASDNGVSTLAVFSRDASAGKLTFEASYNDGALANFISGLKDIAISPDGENVYVVSDSEHAVTVLSRNSTTGALTFREDERDTVNGVDDLEGARSVAVSPDGAQVYVGSLGDDTLTVFNRDAGNNGVLAEAEVHVHSNAVAKLLNPLDVIVHPDGTEVYVAASLSSSLTVFTRNTTTGLLTPRENETYKSPPIRHNSLAISPDGLHIYATDSQSDALVGFNRSAAGGVNFVSTIVDGIGGAAGLNGASAIALSPDGQQAYAAGQLDSEVVVFSRDNASGLLQFIEKHRDGFSGVDGLNSPSDVAVSPDGNQVYVAGASDNAIARFTRDSGTGMLSFHDFVQDGAGGVNGLEGANALSVSPDGNNLYAVGLTDHAVAVFTRDAGNGGALAFVEALFDNVDSPDLGSPFDAVVSPDNQNVYIASLGDDALVVFTRDTGMNGELTLLDTEEDGIGGVSGLFSVRAVVVSPDGAHVYAASVTAVTHFDRNGDGSLDFVDAHSNGAGSITGLSGAISLQVSDDGHFLYVAGNNDDAVVVFRRDQVSGALTHVETQVDESNGFQGLDGIRAITVSSHGAHVYAASQGDDALQVLGLNFDFGDAPSGYPSLLTDDGARHVQSGVVGDLFLLGTLPADIEVDGQPSTTANGDDTNDTSGFGNDEDGVSAGASLQSNGTDTLDITTPSFQTAQVYAWIDFNEDGDWDDVGETSTDCNDKAVTGAGTCEFTVPDIENGYRVLRLRIVGDAGLALGPKGLAPNGEIEDHPVLITDAAATGLGSATVTTTDSNGDPVTVSTDNGVISQITPITTPDGAPGGVSYPNGFFSLQISGLNPGDSATLTFTLPAGSSPDKVIKCYATGCVDYPAFVNGDSFTIVLTDGGNGDRDGVANGVIVDPVAPAVVTGVPGADGADGADGANGADGADGANGTNGTDGAKGDKGDKGDTGDTGATGATGATGDQVVKKDSGSSSGCSMGRPQKPSIELVLMLLFAIVWLSRGRNSAKHSGLTATRRPS